MIAAVPRRFEKSPSNERDHKVRLASNDFFNSVPFVWKDWFTAKGTHCLNWTTDYPHLTNIHYIKTYGKMFCLFPVPDCQGLAVTVKDRSVDDDDEGQKLPKSIEGNLQSLQYCGP